MEFEWDEDKRQSNLSKHGIDFVDAAKIFDRPVLERLDNRYDYEDTRGESNSPPWDVRGETRIIALGEVYGAILFVVYTWRGEVRRIISARRATKRERNQYYQTIYGWSETEPKLDWLGKS